MDQRNKQEKVALHLTWTDHTQANLSARILEFKRRNTRIELDDYIAAIQFLRGTAARASQVLPALYWVMGAGSLPEKKDREHWQIVQAAALEQYSLQAIALACRSIFDDSRNRLNGKCIARLTDDALAQVAKYWAERSNRSLDEASRALEMLRRLFSRCAQPEKLLLDQPSVLERRIGLIKYYAHRQAAHISLEDYLFNIVDLIHVVAAVVLIGAVIIDFDDPWRSPKYFDSIDRGGWQAAKEVFPHLPIERIFEHWDIHSQAALKWSCPYSDGVEFILNQLPAAIGCWDSSAEPPEQGRGL